MSLWEISAAVRAWPQFGQCWSFTSPLHSSEPPSASPGEALPLLQGM